MKKYITTYAAVAVIAAGCVWFLATSHDSLPQGVHVVAFGQPVTLREKDTAIFTDGLQLRLMSINDSRCKPNVQCFWAGELGVTMTGMGGNFVYSTADINLGMVTRTSISSRDYDIILVGMTETNATVKVVATATGNNANGINGYVHIGPSCLDTDPIDPTCVEKVYPEAHVSVTSASGKIIKEVTDAGGSFHLAVPPGTYTVKVQAVASLTSSCEDREVTVTEGKFTKVMIACSAH